MTVLVTGAGGFLGGHLTAELQCYGLRFSAPRVEVGPEADWNQALRGIETVVHLAAVAHERARDTASLRRVNVLGTQRLAQCAAESGVAHFIFMSTIGVHGEETFGTPLTEESPFAPRSPYATSKLEAERVLAKLALSATVLRPALVYGPRNPGNLLRLLRWVERGWPLPVASVANRRSLTYVGNLVSAIVQLVQRPQSGAFIVCDETPISTPELVLRLAAGLHRPAHLFPFPVSALRLLPGVGRRLAGSLEADPAKLSRTLGWHPPFLTADGLRETAGWYRTRGSAAS